MGGGKTLMRPMGESPYWASGERSVASREPPVRCHKAIPTAWLELTLVEGKNRQVRRMTAAVGLPTLRLVRSAIGGFRAPDLAPGQWRVLAAPELREIWGGR